MASDDLDSEVVERLVQELSTPRPAAAPPPAPGQASAPAPDEGRTRQINRWSSVRLLMPARTTSRRRRMLAPLLAAAHLPDLRMPPFSLPGVSLSESGEPTRSALIVRAWVTLGVLLSLSMPFWPYPKTYLLGLLLYLVAVAVVAVAGVWSAKLTWDEHLGGAHTVAVGIVLWAIALVAGETLLVGGGF
jgi:hypothetical protein